MNINFNFGEHYFQNADSSFWIEVLISFIGAFLGFLFALLIDRFVENRQKKKIKIAKKNNDIERLKYLLLLLKSTVKTTKTHIDSFKELSENVKQNPLESFFATKIASNDLKRLQNLDSIELFDSFNSIFSEHKNSSEVYKSIFGAVDFLEEKMEDAFKQNENHRTFQHKDELFVKESIDDVYIKIGLRTKNYRKIYKDNADKIPEYIYLSKFEEIYSRFSESLADFDGIEKDYFKPLHDTMLDNIDDINFADSLFVTVKKALNRLINVRFNSEEFSRDMANLDQDTIERIQYLEEHIEKIEKKIEL